MLTISLSIHPTTYVTIWRRIFRETNSSRAPPSSNPSDITSLRDCFLSGLFWKASRKAEEKESITQIYSRFFLYQTWDDRTDNFLFVLGPNKIQFGYSNTKGKLSARSWEVSLARKRKYIYVRLQANSLSLNMQIFDIWRKYKQKYSHLFPICIYIYTYTYSYERRLRYSQGGCLIMSFWEYH